MMKAMRSLNQDHVTVGWYQTASFDSFINATTVQVQYQHQVEIRSSVLLVHDPHRTAAGHLALRAYRLTDRFLEFYHKGQFSQARYRVARLFPAHFLHYRTLAFTCCVSRYLAAPLF
jgi:translation initiation factor 3 subunit H